MRIIFMGTPEIAVYSLEKILKNNHEVVAVVTSVDKPAGRGQKISMSPVKNYAILNNLKILQPEKLKNEEFLTELKHLNADLYIVVAFRMLPKEVWSLPKFGTINMHASLLPDYRGAAPINWAIINGETKTGVTTFFIDEKIDTGKIIKQKEIEITEDDNAGSLHDKIMVQGAELLIETMDIIEKQSFEAVPQHKFIENEMQLKHAPKIFKDNCRINWNSECRSIYNFIRGLNPYPGAWTNLVKNDENFVFKIFDVKYSEVNHNLLPGTILFDKTNINISCKNGYIQILTLQMEGKKRMKSEEFLRGFNLDTCIFI